MTRPLQPAAPRDRRLCMVVHAPYPLGETRVEREAHAAQAAGWAVDVVAMRAAGDAPEETGADGIRVYRLPVTRVRGGSAARLVREYVGFTALAALKVASLHRRSPYAVVQVHNPPDFLLAAALVPRLLGARTVLDVHDLAPELFALRYEGRRGARLLLWALGLVERVALRAAHRVVTVHEPYRRLLQARGVPPDKITVALNSPEDALLPTGPAPPRAEMLRIVYHGTITPHYGLETLVEAVALLRDRVPAMRVEVYGGGDALPEVKRRAVDRGVADLFRFSDGFVDQRIVLERVQGADVGVIANLPIARNQSALPTKLFEYAALSIPIVSSELAAVRDYFDDTEVRFFDGTSAEKLAEAIADVADDREAAAARAERALRRYESYRWSVAGGEYVSMLERLATEAARAKRGRWRAPRRTSG